MPFGVYRCLLVRWVASVREVGFLFLRIVDRPDASRSPLVGERPDLGVVGPRRRIPTMTTALLLSLLLFSPVVVFRRRPPPFRRFSECRDRCWCRLVSPRPRRRTTAPCENPDSASGTARPNPPGGADRVCLLFLPRGGRSGLLHGRRCCGNDDEGRGGVHPLPEDFRENICFYSTVQEHLHPEHTLTDILINTFQLLIINTMSTFSSSPPSPRKGRESSGLLKPQRATATDRARIVGDQSVTWILVAEVLAVLI